MKRELKLRIKNHKEIEEKLKSLGTASFDGEQYFINTYFNQPQGTVLKISENNKGFFLVNLVGKNGGFEIIKNEPLDDPKKIKQELTSKYGIKKILKGKRRFYQWNDFKITINLIDDVGEFLILTGENPTKQIVEETLGITPVEYIRVSFDELK